MAFITRSSLLDKIKQGDEQAWADFYEQYRPLVWLKGKDYNLANSEQDELLSDVMLDLFNAQKNFSYQREKGRFRDYFRTLIINRIFKIIKKRTPVDDGADLEKTNVLDERPSPDEDENWQATIFNQALTEIKQTMDPEQVQVFIRHQLKQEDMTEIIKNYHISLATGYNWSKAVEKELTVRARQLSQEY